MQMLIQVHDLRYYIPHDFSGNRIRVSCGLERTPGGHLVQPAAQSILQEVNKITCCCFPGDPGKYQKILDDDFIFLINTL